MGFQLSDRADLGSQKLFSKLTSILPERAMTIFKLTFKKLAKSEKVGLSQAKKGILVLVND